MKEREKLKSRMGFILISAGCAIGIGNVWKFPYIAGKGGGGAFVLCYLIFLVILGLPVMTMEFAVGRASQKSPVKAYQALEKPGQKWHIHGYITVIESDPAEAEVLVPVAPPALDEGPHLSYALQWFAFTVIGVIGIGVLVRADLRDRKKAKAAREKAGTSPDEAVDEEPSTPAPHEVG